MNYKIISSLKNLNLKLFSVEKITRKLYDIEYLKKNYNATHNAKSLYFKNLLATVGFNIENNKLKDEEYIFIHE